MKNTLVSVTKMLAVAALVFTVQTAKADDAGSPANVVGGGSSDSNGGSAVPIDGGASLLIAGGLAYGLKRLKSKKA